MRLSIYHHADGVRTGNGVQVVYDLANEVAHFGAASVEGAALRWALEDAASADALLSVPLAPDRATQWLLRCDRVDFPPGAIAWRHVHPGRGIRCLLFGAIEIQTEGRTTAYGPLGAWFESGPEPVVAVASSEAATAFVRVMLLPREWRGRRTVRYLDPADDARPKLQQARIFFDIDVAL